MMNHPVKTTPRHVAELLGKFGTAAASGRETASPGEELFTRFRNSFSDINATLDYSNVNEFIRRFDWDRWEGTSVSRAAKKAKEKMLELLRAGCFQRNDYKFAAELILIFLGCRIGIGSNFVFPDLAKASNARFLQRCLYFILIQLLIDVPLVRDMFTDREKETIANMALFCAVYYGPYFLQTPIASRLQFCSILWLFYQFPTVLQDWTWP